MTRPVIGPDGAVWAGNNSNAVVRVDPDTSAVTQFALPGTPVGLIAGPDGLLWIVTYPIDARPDERVRNDRVDGDDCSDSLGPI